MSAVSQVMLDSLPLSLVETLFESAHEAIDCAGMAFLEPVLLSLSAMLPRYLSGVKGISFLQASSHWNSQQTKQPHADCVNLHKSNLYEHWPHTSTLEA